MVDRYMVRDFNDDDPLPDVFNHYLIGHILVTTEGRKYRRDEMGQWVPLENNP